LMSYAMAFSNDFTAARQRFCQAAIAIGCTLETYPINALGPNGEKLSIDIARYGPEQPKHLLVISSGLHGVEGFLGSAVQLVLLEQYLGKQPLNSETGVLLVHALNPYGFAWLRRCNENNVDLNRNFLLDLESFAGSPKDYPKLDRFFNPTSPPSAREWFWLKAIALIARYGMASLKNTLPVGQYDFPKGLFFGGQQPSQTQKILETQLPQWIGDAGTVLHLDLHTGLGPKGICQLLIDRSAVPGHIQSLAASCEAQVIRVPEAEGPAYQIRGGLGGWCEVMFPDLKYEFITAEFGTYPVVRVVEALRAENRAHWWGRPEDKSYQQAKQQLKEIFVPADAHWREIVVRRALELVLEAFELIQADFEQPSKQPGDQFTDPKPLQNQA
jgi:hypothetical protein